MTSRFVLVGVVAALLASACSEPAGPPAIVAPPVVVERVEAHRIEDRIEATGQLLAPSQAAVASQVGGQITRIARDEGDALAAGDLVIEIDPERRQLEVDSARALLAQAEAQTGETARELERIERLHKQGVASEARLDEARTALRSMQASRDALRAQLGMSARSLKDSSVTAPFAGFVARRYVSEGEYVTPGQTLFDLVALDPIEVEFHVSERDSGRVALGASVEVRVAPFPEESFRAVVTLVSPTIDAATRTLRVEASLANPDGRLRPGLFARADLGVAVREGVAMIPEEAVLQRADGPVAFRLVDQNQVERRALELGVVRAGRIEVRNGLRVGDHVVVRGQGELMHGSVVSVRDVAGAPVESRSTAVGDAGSTTAQPVVH
jgi:membrane fusion protein (multidrug efflux system)